MTVSGLQELGTVSFIFTFLSLLRLYIYHCQLPSLYCTFCSRLALSAIDAKCKFLFVAIRPLTVSNSPYSVVSAINF